MAGAQTHLVRIDADAPGAEAALTAAVESADAVLVHRSGTRFAQGAQERLLRVLRRPHRRLVRVHTGGDSCYLARTELIASAVHHGISTAMLIADPPGLDREIARAVHALDLDARTPVEDLTSGRWRQWVDGAVVGVSGEAQQDGWERSVARQHSGPARALTFARRRAGLVRREVQRVRQRQR